MYRGGAKSFFKFRISDLYNVLLVPLVRLLIHGSVTDAYGDLEGAALGEEKGLLHLLGVSSGENALGHSENDAVETETLCAEGEVLDGDARVDPGEMRFLRGDNDDELRVVESPAAAALYPLGEFLVAGFDYPLHYGVFEQIKLILRGDEYEALILPVHCGRSGESGLFEAE